MERPVYQFKFSESGRNENTLSLTMEGAIEIARNRVINRGCEVKLYVLCHDRFVYLGEYCPALDGIYSVRAYPKPPKRKIYGFI